jgi:signal transduction histidine kinase/tetratricopeptide (TPR) repeat protein
MRTFRCFLLTVFLFPACFSQNKEIDSLKHQLALTKHDTTRALILAQLAQLTRNRASDSTALYAQEALALARKIKVPKAEALALRSLGQFFRIKGDLSKALDFQMRAIQVAENNQLWEEQSIILSSIGTIYLDLKDNNKAITYLKKALAIPQSAGNEERRIRPLINLSAAYRLNHQLGLALSTLKSIQQEVNASNSLEIKAFFFAEWSQVQFELDNYENGIAYMKKTILLSQSLNIQRIVASGYASLARYFQKLNQRDSAIYYARQGLSLAQAIAFKRDILSSSKLLAELYEPQDFQKALFYRKLAMETNDELFGAAKVQELQKIVWEEQERQRKIETERAAYQNRLKQYALLAGLGIMFLIGFILYRNNRQKQKANQVLENTLTDLKTAQVQLENRNRDLEIETALERVRTRAMAMQSSEDVGICVATMFAELDKLGVKNIRCGIAVLHPSQTMEVWSFNTSEDGKTRHGTGLHDVNAHPLWQSLYQGWEQKMESAHYFLQGQDRINYFRVVTNNPNYKLSDAVIELPDQHFQAYYFPEGAIWTFSLHPHSDKDKQILKKITAVFSLTFRRYQDLKTAEAQTREARIEVALERVRSRTMAMHHSNELTETASVLFQQLKDIGLSFWASGFCIYRTDDRSLLESWMNNGSTGGFLPPMLIPFEEDTGHRNIYEASLRGELTYVQKIEGDELANHYNWMMSIPSAKAIFEQLDKSGIASPMVQWKYAALFKQGYLLIISAQPQTVAVGVIKRFAVVFEQAYTRFLDLQKAEAQALDLVLEKQRLEKTLAELRTTQAQLIQKEKLASLGELTAGIAHEIQNPLNFVNNFSELSIDLAQELYEEIDKEPIDTEFVKELMADLTQNQEKINHHGKRASSIVKGMLEHSRTGTGERQLTDINQLTDEYLRLSYHGLRAKDSLFNSDYELIIDKNLPIIEVVPQEIGRVLLNLINNAFYAVSEYTKQGKSDYQPKVTVSTTYADNQSDRRAVEIRVTDNGTGIPEAIKSKIFQPFFTTKPTGEGTGLGLSLSYDIVTKGHAGTMEVESVEGEGTTFIVKLPIM